jgi:acetylornithine deacetylase/succinyl-diaminopimelate desuccinylase-like protein
VEETLKFIEENKERFLEELKDYLRIPSISAKAENKNDMLKCAQFVVSKLKDAGIKKTKIYKTKLHPIVYGEWLGAKGAPTVLIYGHYDVQPPEPLELWETPPFEPDIRDGKIYARGANDNKGQNFVHIKSIESQMKTVGKLPVNVKFVIEGEEEVGSESLTQFIKEHKEMLKCDAVLISDTSLYAEGVPTINYGLRGLTYMEVEVQGPNRDLHSGSFGGAIANPINELAKIIAKLHDKNGKVTIPNFYKDVAKISKKEKENIKALKFSDRKFAKEYGVRELQGEKGYSTLERLWVRPTLDCNGIYGGYTGEGAKTVLPAKATAKISMRLVPNQNPKKIAKEFTKYVKSLAPKSVKISVKEMHGGYPIAFSLDDKAIQAGAKAVGKAFGKKTVFTREGGSIPIVVDFKQTLNAPVVLMGLGLDTDDIHSPNEHFNVDSFFKGIYSSVYFMAEFAKGK